MTPPPAKVVKFAGVRPVTAWLNVTVNGTVAASVGFVPAIVIEGGGPTGFVVTR